MWLRFAPLVLILLIAGSLPACQKSAEQKQQDRYPWQITILADGSSRIFGIQLGVTTVSEAKRLVGKTPRIALFENPDGGLSLELFYKDRAGLTGRLVLTLSANNTVLQGFKQQAVKKGKLESGVLQYRLDTSALAQIETWPVAAMTYVPYANLEEQIIIGRFG